MLFFTLNSVLLVAWSTRPRRPFFTVEAFLIDKAIITISAGRNTHASRVGHLTSGDWTAPGAWAASVADGRRGQQTPGSASQIMEIDATSVGG
jgi:hypothetical protein